MDKRRILFIDDEPFEMSPIKDALEFEEKYEVLLAEDETEALQAIENETFDLIILDIMMTAEKNQEDPAASRTTGIRIGRIIKNKHPQTPIICLSVVKNRMVKDQMKQFATYIEKPALPSQVLRVVEQALTGSE
jgi:CheY-like chemotaxis protein